MREHKFKVWDKENKRMIEWDELKLLPSWEIFTKNKENDTMIVFEFSGLVDKLGNEIYEGDVIEYQGEKYHLEFLEPFKH